MGERTEFLDFLKRIETYLHNWETSTEKELRVAAGLSHENVRFAIETLEKKHV